MAVVVLAGLAGLAGPALAQDRAKTKEIVVGFGAEPRTIRHPDVDPDVEKLALTLVLVRHFDHHAARHDRLEKSLELVGLFADMRLERVGMFNVAKRDLQGCFHVRILPFG
jgi:hypothetical protein